MEIDEKPKFTELNELASQGVIEFLLHFDLKFINLLIIIID